MISFPYWEEIVVQASGILTVHWIAHGNISIVRD